MLNIINKTKKLIIKNTLKPKLAFDFVCYNDCKQRNSDSICQ
jgi:hypothetical protein